MRRLTAVFCASLVLAGLLAVPIASGVAAATASFAGFSCGPNGTLAGTPRTTLSTARIDTTTSANSVLTCLWRGTSLPMAFSGPCQFQNASYIVDFTRRTLFSMNGQTYLTCSGATAVTPKTDLSITKTDGTDTAVAGQSTTYTITVTNNGPNAVTGATVVDNFSAELVAGAFTSVAAGGATGNTASGSGFINDTLNLPVGSTVTYTTSPLIRPSATGDVINTATVTAPAGIVDSNPANNSATDTDSVPADLSIQVFSANILAGDICPGALAAYNASSVSAGQKSCYVVIVRNLGPNPATNVTIHLTVVNGSSTLDDESLGTFPGPLAVGGTITVSNLRVAVPANATGTVVATGTVSATQLDVNSANNTAMDTDTVLSPT